ncbi:MAG TPA: hypothetical protein VFL16_16975 [Steroidobacteraceae bacterium]|jgi:hypothetical protein|nr:hypothetical protein [Steroidobacteraceae bacterium]
MNFQEKVFKATDRLRERAARRVEGLRQSLVVLNKAGRELNQVARLHAGRFVKQNSPLVSAARKDVAELARNTFATLTGTPTAKKPVRKTATTRNRRRKAA